MVFIGMIDWSQWMLFLLLKKQNFLAKNNVCIYVLTTFRCAFVLVCKILSATGVTWIYAPLVVHHTEQQVLWPCEASRDFVVAKCQTQSFANRHPERRMFSAPQSKPKFTASSGKMSPQTDFRLNCHLTSLSMLHLTYSARPRSFSTMDRDAKLGWLGKDLREKKNQF